MKLSILKVAIAIPCGPKTETVFQASEYDIEKEELEIKITHKSVKTPSGGPVEAFTSLFNSVYWKYLDGSLSGANKPSSKPGSKSKEL